MSHDTKHSKHLNSVPGIILWTLRNSIEFHMLNTMHMCAILACDRFQALIQLKQIWREIWFPFVILLLLFLLECKFLIAHLLRFPVQKRSTYQIEVLRAREIWSRGFSLDSPEPSPGKNSSTSTFSSSDSSSPDMRTKTHATPKSIPTKFHVQPTNVGLFHHCHCLVIRRLTQTKTVYYYYIPSHTCRDVQVNSTSPMDVRSDLQHLLKFGNKLKTGESVQSMTSLLVCQFVDNFKMVDIKHKVWNLVQHFLTPN